MIERIPIHSHYSISRIIKGGWHLAGGHGVVDEAQAIEDMRAFVEAGITTFDCADIYTGVEVLIGKFLKKYKKAFISADLPPVQIHTKYVPDIDALATLSPDDTTAIIDRSLQRLGVESLDLVQFAWWDYNIHGYVEAALQLTKLKDAGKIRNIGVTNFDSQHLMELLDAGVPIAMNQVQYSILDRRVENDLTPIAKKFNIPFLCYGSVAGGFLSDRYLNSPDPPEPLENRSLTKYRLIIEEFGGYSLFQEVLELLRSIANPYQVDIAEVAMRYILQKPMVAGIIVGARNTHHLKKLSRLGNFKLNENDLNKIQNLISRSIGPLGPFYALERDKNGKHGSIMKYNLNTENE